MTALTPDAPASRPRRGEGHTPTVQSPPEDISPLPQSQPPPPPPPPPPPQQTARATNQRRLTDEEIRDYLADRGAAAMARLKEWDRHGCAARLLPHACPGAQVRKGGKGYAQDPAAQPPRQPPPTTRTIPQRATARTTAGAQTGVPAQLPPTGGIPQQTLTQSADQ